MFRTLFKTKSIPVYLGVGLILHEYSQNSIRSDSLKKIPVTEFIKHNSPNDIWVSIDKKVYDLSGFLLSHPGGMSAIMKYAGKDATKPFEGQHPASLLTILPEESYIGVLDGNLEEMKTVEQNRIDEIQKGKPSISQMFNVSDFEAIAKQILPWDLYIYFATGSDDEATLRECHLAYSRVFFRPRILQNVSSVDHSTTMLGNKVNFPFYITSFAGKGLIHPEGESLLARMANKHKLMYIIPRLSTKPVAEVLKSFDKDTPVWCQAHANQSDVDLTKTFTELEKYDQVKGIFISTDCAAAGNREKDYKVRQQLENFEPSLASFASPLKKYPTITWDDIKRLKASTSKKVLLKGVQRSEDVLKAAEIGLDGVVISSHGGRQLDFSQPPLEILAESMPLLREKEYYSKEQFEVYIDGGIRRATDMLKALALGAAGVGLGKPFAYALASYGEEGVEKLIDIYDQELVRDMQLLGVRNIEELNETFVNVKGLYNRIGNYSDSYFKNYEPLPVPKFVR